MLATFIGFSPPLSPPSCEGATECCSVELGDAWAAMAPTRCIPNHTTVAKLPNSPRLGIRSKARLAIHPR